MKISEHQYSALPESSEEGRGEERVEDGVDAGVAVGEHVGADLQRDVGHRHLERREALQEEDHLHTHASDD